MGQGRWLYHWPLALAIVAASAAARGASSHGPPRFFELEDLDVTSIRQAAESGLPVTLRLLDRTYVLVLEPRHLRSPRFRATAGAIGERRRVFPRAVTILAGYVDGEPQSMVRLSFTRRGILGCIKFSEGWIFVEPVHPGDGPRKLPPGIRRHMVFTDGDIDVTFEDPCGDDMVEPPEGYRDASPAAVQPEEPPVAGMDAAIGAAAEPATAASTLRVLELAIDTDFEYSQACAARGVTPTEEVESVLNIVDGIYQVELGIQISLVYVHNWDAEPDPYSSTDSNGLLVELRDFWNENRGGVSRDLVHLFTGKDLDGNTVGLAYVSVVCYRTVAYGLSQDLDMVSSLMPLLVAHEVGHNLGAGHDPDGSTPRYIMYPSLSSSTLDEFSDLTAGQIEAFVATTTCLSTAGGGVGGTTTSTPTGGTGGGGPVDPLLLVLLAAGCLGMRRLPAGGKR